MDIKAGIFNKILPQIEDWQNRPLDEVYPILYIDAIHYSVRDNGVIRKLAAYVILGINTEGKKEVLSITVGDNESSKYWLSVLNELKNRGVKDILIICADGLSGIKEARVSTNYKKVNVYVQNVMIPLERKPNLLKTNEEKELLIVNKRTVIIFSVCLVVIAIVYVCMEYFKENKVFQIICSVIFIFLMIRDLVSSRLIKKLQMQIKVFALRILF